MQRVSTAQSAQSTCQAIIKILTNLLEMQPIPSAPANNIPTLSCPPCITNHKSHNVLHMSAILRHPHFVLQPDIPSLGFELRCYRLGGLRPALEDAPYRFKMIAPPRSMKIFIELLQMLKESQRVLFGHKNA